MLGELIHRFTSKQKQIVKSDDLKDECADKNWSDREGEVFIMRGHLQRTEYVGDGTAGLRKENRVRLHLVPVGFPERGETAIANTEEILGPDSPLVKAEMYCDTRHPEADLKKVRPRAFAKRGHWIKIVKGVTHNGMYSFREACTVYQNLFFGVLEKYDADGPQILISSAKGRQ